MKLSVLLLALLVPFSGAYADEGPYLDHDYHSQEDSQALKLKHVFSRSELNEIEALDEPFEKVDHLQTALMQTPVKSQGRRGTCSIFSSTAILEYNLKKIGMTEMDLDLSEQWLEYITAGQRGSEGSWSYYNFDQYGEYGFVDESAWPYNKTSWHPYKESYWETADALEKAIFNQFCKPLENTSKFDGCLIGQMDPRLLNLNDSTLLERNALMFERREAAEDSISSKLKIGSQSMWDNADVQDSLDRGEVVALDVSFFYEAWNHGKSTSMGLEKDVDLWSQGKVGYPHPDSLDYQESRKSDNRAGHSIVIVGYDHDVEWTREVKDRDGNMMEVKTKGVYYFKNSWGADSETSFGAEFELKGEKLPGFGMISMDYAHRHGSFYKMTIRKIAQ